MKTNTVDSTIDIKEIEMEYEEIKMHEITTSLGTKGSSKCNERKLINKEIANEVKDELSDNDNGSLNVNTLDNLGITTEQKVAFKLLSDNITNDERSKGR